ncbi:protein Diedel-like [Drosophila hydei]|uniref:Protein Diedel-like n=1 Tax=Drosophila hydei TaxID=7224 RepID=A0A6J1LI82_DROHY|nr:protein Diedel-like [Drosophila hydei]
MKHISILLALICVLACVGSLRAQCCRQSLTLMYRYNRPGRTCADAGGRLSNNPNICTITICADGRAKQGSYCGRGPCNIFGCNCDYGCIPGNWMQTFLERNRRLGVTVTDSRWSAN